MNINMKTDYSYLFSSLPGSSSGSASGMSTFLADYASIKNGSYGKLMKAYYTETGASKEVSSIADNKKDSISTTRQKELAQVQTDADALKESADALIAKVEDSLFKQKDVVTKDKDGKEVTTKEYDVDAIYNAVNSFVKDYNSLVDSADEADSYKIEKGLDALTDTTKIYNKMLSNVGITVNEDQTLSIDEEKFKGADMEKVQELFQSTGSYAYSVSAKASMLDYYASSESNKADTYNVNGNYSGNFATGNLFSTYM